jgi:hypothetical protein
MKTILIPSVLAAALAAGSGSAHADVLTLYGMAEGGLASGTGISGAQKDNTFHEGAQGAAYGALVGVEFLFFDGFIEHTQYRNSDGLAGTWTQFMAGMDVNLDLGAKKDTKPGPDGKPTGGFSSMYGELGLAIGFGVGTGQQVNPPLDYAQVSDRGFLAQVSAGIGWRLTRVISLGLRVPVQAGYMFKKGVANDQNNQYVSAQAAALANFRLDFELK